MRAFIEYITSRLNLRFINNHDGYTGDECKTSSQVLCRSSPLDREDSVRFDIIPAKGGLILNVTRFDCKTDRTVRSIHTVVQKETYAADISSIVVMEMLTY